MKTVGIIGGLGPETTAKFYLQVVSLCGKIDKKQRPSILIQNVAITKTLEESFINQAQGGGELCKLLIKSAQNLEKGGADFIVIPCNTVHVFIDDIRASVSIPVLSIIDETVKVLKKNKINKIGLLSTPATIKTKLFNKTLDINLPKKSDQKQMGIIINCILNNQRFEENRNKLLTIIENLSEKSDALLLACTDLQLIIPEKEINGATIFDTMEILANATTREITA